MSVLSMMILVTCISCPVVPTEACEEEGALSTQDRSSSLDQKDPPQIKGEQEEEQLELKQETFMWTPTHEESHQQLLPHGSPAAEDQDQNGSNHVDSGSPENTEPELKRHHENTSVSKNPDSCPMSETRCKNEKLIKCDTCSEEFRFSSLLRVHQRVHTTEKPYGEKLFSCKTCWKPFRTMNNLRAHIRSAHVGEKLYLCRYCGKRFTDTVELKSHMRSHTGENRNDKSINK